HVLQRFGNAADQEDRHQAGVEATWTNRHRVELADRTRDRWVDGHGRLEPDAFDEAAGRLAGIDFDLAARHRPIVVLRADRRLLNADRPDTPAAAEQRTQAVDGVEEVA